MTPLSATMTSHPTAQRTPFGILRDGTPVDLLTISTSSGMTMRVMTYGGIILSLTTPDRHGVLGDIVLGYDSLAEYEAESPYFGAIIGRYGNRIARGQFALDGTKYQLSVNNGPNHLHGGVRGFDKVVWDAITFTHDDRAGVIFTHQSPDGTEGYPGTLDVQVSYTLTNAGALRIEYDAMTDRPTPVNLTHHSYFNLAGATRDIFTHELTVYADAYTPVNQALIPTGEIRSVHGTPFDFRQPTPMGARIQQADEQLVYAGGYDHNFVLTQSSAPGLHRAATVREPESGRTIDVSTTEPGMQFYSGNFLDGTLRGKGGQVYAHRFGFCLETQHFPDSPNHSAFPSTTLRPGERYHSETVYQFGVVTD